ncbi:MAG TPA: metallophosphoesterase family protein, partial [Bacteroidales bacterium]|nr:metallophosphoesterase family protein [Bacteroidales bacterium]
HIGGYPGRYDLRALRLIEAHRPNLFVCGHSHILRVINDKHYNMLTLNPGAAGLQGFHLVRTALRFHISDGKIHDMEVGEWERNFTKQ